MLDARNETSAHFYGARAFLIRFVLAPLDGTNVKLTAGSFSLASGLVGSRDRGLSQSFCGCSKYGLCRSQGRVSRHFPRTWWYCPNPHPGVTTLETIASSQVA